MSECALANNLRVFDVDGVPFVETPYRAGTYIRQGTFWRQFAVICDGAGEYPEDNRKHGTYWMDSSLSLGFYGLVEDAMAHAAKVALTGAYDLDDRSDALRFSGKIVTIQDRERRLVLAGEITRSGGIEWCVPVATDTEAETVRAQVAALRSSASYESGWDNSFTAKTLRHRADVLEGRLIHRVWSRPVRKGFLSWVEQSADRASLAALAAAA
jgi:hypothetical protein